jgi:hypothetical protein
MARSRTTVEAGNTLAMTHGAKSLRITAERTRQIVDAWLDPETGLRFTQPVDIPALIATAAAYARLEEMTAYLEGRDQKGRVRGAVDARGRPRGCMPMFVSTYRAVMQGLKDLGATPGGRAAMAGSLATLQSAKAAAEAEQRLRDKYAPPEKT